MDFYKITRDHITAALPTVQFDRKGEVLFDFQKTDTPYIYKFTTADPVLIEKLLEAGYLTAPEGGRPNIPGWVIVKDGVVPYERDLPGAPVEHDISEFEPKGGENL